MCPGTLSGMVPEDLSTVPHPPYTAHSAGATPKLSPTVPGYIKLGLLQLVT